MKEKISNLSTSTKIILALLAVTIIMATTLGIAFATHTDFKKLINADETAKAMSIPNVTRENIDIKVSNAEETEESVIIKANSKLENYKLYYYIDPIEIEETSISQEKQAAEDLGKIENKDYTIYENGIEILSNAKVYLKYELEGIYSEEAYTIEINNIKELIETNALENEMATEEELEKARVTEKDNIAKYYIIVNYSSNVVTVYEKDEEGNYTIPVKAMVCSTGSATPKSGIYKLTRSRYRWRALFGNVYGQYAVPIVGNILFHSVPYLKNGDPSSLEYWEYDKLGTSASAGCIRLTVADAIWIYNNCGTGTQVEFSAVASNPLGKPAARKISEYTELRGYDPTDPTANNPWRNANINEPIVSTTPIPEIPTPSIPAERTPTPSQTTTPNPTIDPDPTTTPSMDPDTTLPVDPTPSQPDEPSPEPTPTLPVDPEEGNTSEDADM